MTTHNDLKRYYKILGIPANASAEEIKRAYRRLAKELHPDRHSNDRNATAKFQALNEAYTVLSNPQTRAAYDAVCIATQTPSKERVPVEPVVCSSCGAVSAQPRYVIFWYVMSLLFVSSRRAIQGVFCPACATKKAVLASTITWLLGWWGIPWGPIWSIAAIYRNLLNGTQPADANVNIIGRQVLYFLENGRRDLAAVAIDQALSFKSSAPLREHLYELRDAIPPPRAPLIDRWKLPRRSAFWVQLAPIFAALIAVAWLNINQIIMATARQDLAHVGMRANVLAGPRSGAQVLAAVRPFEDFQVLAGWGTDLFDRVVTKHGVVGYVQRSAVIFGDGDADLRKRCFPSGPVHLSNGVVFRRMKIGPHKLKVSNGLSLDAVVKLRDMSRHTALSFYVTAGKRVEIDDVPEGTYMIEFATGHDFSPRCGYFLSGMTSRRFLNFETFKARFRGNYRYTSVLDITLNPVSGGTAHTVTTDDTLFERD